jgi:hypothetical protein
MANPAARSHHGNANDSNTVVPKWNSNNRFTLSISLQSENQEFANAKVLLVEAPA